MEHPRDYRLLDTEVAADLEKFEAKSIVQLAGNIDAEEMFSGYRQGFFFFELEGILVSAISAYREIIPVDNHLSHSLRRSIHKEGVNFSTNHHFVDVMHACSIPRKNSKTPRQWMGPKIQKRLVELHHNGVAHSVEVCKDNQLVGGLVGLTFGGIFVGLSVFGAGNAAFAALKTILHEQGFGLIDAISPSNISRVSGGRMISTTAYSFVRDDSAKMNLNFPTRQGSLSDLIQPHSQPDRDQDNGRTFPRKERDASEGQDRSQAVENIRQAGARNRGLCQARIA